MIHKRQLIEDLRVVATKLRHAENALQIAHETIALQIRTYDRMYATLCSLVGPREEIQR